MISALGIQ